VVAVSQRFQQPGGLTVLAHQTDQQEQQAAQVLEQAVAVLLVLATKVHIHQLKDTTAEQAVLMELLVTAQAVVAVLVQQVATLQHQLTKVATAVLVILTLFQAVQLLV
jgi:cation transport ATPase